MRAVLSFFGWVAATLWSLLHLFIHSTWSFARALLGPTGVDGFQAEPLSFEWLLNKAAVFLTSATWLSWIAGCLMIYGFTKLLMAVFAPAPSASLTHDQTMRPPHR